MEENWSIESQIRTYEVLGYVDFDAFSQIHSEECRGCTLKSLDQQSGYVTRDDALKHEWNIFDIKDDHLLSSYSSLNALVDAGWVVG